MISARHTTNRQSFKKVTCPFKSYVPKSLFISMKLPAPSGNYDRQTDQPTNRPTTVGQTGSYREVSISIICLGTTNLYCIYLGVDYYIMLDICIYCMLYDVRKYIQYCRNLFPSATSFWPYWRGRCWGGISESWTSHLFPVMPEQKREEHVVVDLNF